MVQTVSGDSHDQCSHSCADASQRAGVDPGLGHPRCQRQQEVQHRSADALETDFQAGVLSRRDDQAPGGGHHLPQRTPPRPGGDPREAGRGTSAQTTTTIGDYGQGGVAGRDGEQRAG
eukprot:7657853-Pyramimonas_sp.AAC.1